MGDVELAALDLLQQVPEVVVVEGQGADQQGVQDDPARPDVRLPPVVFLALEGNPRGIRTPDHEIASTATAALDHKTVVYWPGLRRKQSPSIA